MKNLLALTILCLSSSVFANPKLCLQNVLKEHNDLTDVEIINSPQKILGSKDLYVIVDYKDECSAIYRCRADEKFSAYYADNTCGEM